MNLFSNFFNQETTQIDPRINLSLSTSVNSVIHGASLSLTSIGRHNGSNHNKLEKHSIKRADRLIGNNTLHSNRINYYQIIAAQFISTTSPLIIVDWSSVYNYNFVMLRAAISIGGRAITLYEEVYPNEKHGNHKAHVRFLANLKSVLPVNCHPIICTDAGFKVPWFKAVEAHKWYWLGRVRGVTYCQVNASNEWELVSSQHKKAETKATEFTHCLLSKSHAYYCRGVLFKKSAKGRKNTNRLGVVTKDYNNIKHSKSAKEPWFLVSNLPKVDYPKNTLVVLYTRRMSIEETFRDNKNEYYGLGLTRSRSRSVERLECILLIAMIAQILLYVIGKAAEFAGYHKHFQANTRKKRVLSYGFLALRVIQHSRVDFEITELMLKQALNKLIEECSM